MRILKTILIAALVAFHAAEARAQLGPSFGPLVGFSKSSDTDAKVLFGAALRLKFLSALAVEGSINYRSEDFAGVTVRSWPVQVTGLLYPLPIVHAAVGAGWYHTTFDFDEATLMSNDTQREFGWHFGGGVELPLGAAAVLTGDLRYVFIDYNFEAVPGSGDVKDDFYMVTAGLLFKL